MSTNKPKITEIESYGVESIPHEDRRSTPMDLFRIAFGGANSFATVLLGAFPIFFVFFMNFSGTRKRTCFSTRAFSLNESAANPFGL